MIKFLRIICIQKKINHVFKKRFCTNILYDAKKDPSYIEFVGNWIPQDKHEFLKDMIIEEDFLSKTQEEELFMEVEPYMKRLRYEFDHWDDAIHGFRETERQHWYPHNKEIILKINKIAFDDEIMPYIHVLDLAANGVIKPHVDSSRYCGSTIAGLSLLSNCVMRMVRIDETKYQQSSNEKDDYRNTNNANMTKESSDVPKFSANVLLKQRSLYIMRNSARYKFTHEILGNEHSIFKNENIQKDRRISIICRNKP